MKTKNDPGTLTVAGLALLGLGRGGANAAEPLAARLPAGGGLDVVELSPFAVDHHV